MIYHKITIILMMSLIFLSACTKEQRVEENDKESFMEVEDLGDYQINTPFKFGLARGLMVENISNKIDIVELELGLMKFSTTHFPTENHTFQEGQYLTKEDIEKWASRKSTDSPEGLNSEINFEKERLEAEKKNPIILSHVLEQNYIDKDGKLAGISIALALNKIYYIKFSENGLLYSENVEIQDEDILKEGKLIAGELLKKIRQNEDIPDVPIFLTLYQLNKQNSFVPGKFLEKTYISSGKSTIKKWDDIERVYYALNTNSVKTNDKQTYDMIENFKEDIEVNFQGVNINFLGKGLYINNELSSVEIDIDTIGVSKSQSIALTQFVGSQILQGVFPKYIPITVHIKDGVNELFIVKWDPTKEKVFTQNF